jgi:hypothetical protein
MNKYIFVPFKEFMPHLYYNGKINPFFYNLCCINKDNAYILDILKKNIRSYPWIKSVDSNVINLRNIKFIKLLESFDYNPPPKYKIEHIIGDFGNILNKEYFNKCFYPKNNKNIYFIKY